MTATARKRRRRALRAGHVRAKELAEMGFCEKRILLAHLHGELTTPSQRECMHRGRLAHHWYHEQGLAAGSSDRRCCIATCVFGDSAPQTQVLREFRDAVLLRGRCGRRIVTVYYKFAPAACVILGRSPALLKLARLLLDALVVRLQRASIRKGRE